MSVTNPNRSVRVKDLDRFRSNLKANDMLHPVKINSLTPSSTFVKNALLVINGVMYRSKVATSHFPVTLVTQDGQFVIHTVNGKTAFVIGDNTLNSDWEIFSDASIEYWVETMNARITQLESDRAALQNRCTALESITADVTYGGQTYTARQLLENLAQLMDKTVVYA